MTEHEDRREDHDAIATLLRTAGMRPAVSPDRLERAREAARVQWRRQTASGSRRWFSWAAAAVVVVAAGLVPLAVRWLSIGTAEPAGSPVLVESLAGTVRVHDAAGSRVPGVGGALASGAEVSTSADGRVALLLASGHSVRLDTSTRIRLLDTGSLELEAGAVYADSGFRAGAGTGLTVHTPLGRVEEIGTQFEVRLTDGSVRVRLREGSVIVKQDGRVHNVTAGEQLVLGVDGSAERTTIPLHGAGWDWIVGVTPMLDLEGRTAREFLIWAARERGWALAFADESVATAARDVVLSGAFDQLTLEEALDVVLPISRMTYRVEDGVLLISPEPGSGAM